MAYSTELAATLRRLLTPIDGVSERKMFGGICFMVHGNMLCGVAGERGMFRIGQDREEEALRRPGTSLMDFTGRPMSGIVWVAPEYCTEENMADWIAMALSYVGEMPEKVKQPTTPRRIPFLAGRGRV